MLKKRINNVRINKTVIGGNAMICPDCGKKLPDNAVKCNKCGKTFKQQIKNTETDDFLKKEKEKAEIRAVKLQQKNEKRRNRKPVNKKAIIIACAAVALAAVITVIVLFATGVFSFKKDGPDPDHPKKEYDIEYTPKEVAPEDILLESDGVKIAKDEYEFFFRQSYSNIQNASRLSFQDYAREKTGEDFDENNLDAYYEQFGAEFFEKNEHTFDYKKPVNNQSSTALDENKKEITWQEYIRNDAISTLKTYRVKFALAEQSGMELTDDVRYQVYSHIEGLRSAVSNGGGGTLNDYLKMLFGESCNEEYFKNELIREYMASKYDTVHQQELIDSYSADAIKAIYDKNNAKYDYADISVFEVTAEAAKKAQKEIKEVADTIYKNTKNLDGFTAAIQKELGITSDKTSLPAVPGYYLEQTYSSDLSAWVFDRTRKADDVNIFKTANGYTVVVIQAPAYSKKDSATYREIVLKKTDDEGKTLSEEKLLELKATADEIMEKCRAKDADEDTFSFYALTKSTSSSATSGGLVGCLPADEMTEEIKAWASENRKPGDIGMVETDEAITILRYGKSYGDYWNYAVRSEKAAEDNEKEIDKAKASKFNFTYDKNAISEFESTLIVSLNRIYLGIGL